VNGKKDALQIFRAALRASDPLQAVLRHLRFDGRVLIAGRRKYVLSHFDRILVIGAGKASAAMASAVEHLLGGRVTGGLVNVPDGVSARLRRVRLQSARHPLPDQRGVQGAREIADIARAAGPRDLVIVVISGGASALLPAPRPPLTLLKKQALTRTLMNGGANIHELNAIRKHLSLLKGGQLAALAHPAPVLALILSDVIGDDLDVIGSGPTVADRSTLADAEAVLSKYGAKAPVAAFAETPKPGDERLKLVQNLIVGSNRLAIDAAAKKAKELGYRTLVLSTFIDGEAREIAAMHAAIVKEILAADRPIRRPACILSGGETTVTVHGAGVGGRSQEFVLAAAIALNGCELDGGDSVTILSAGTDGADGPCDAAGAIADGHTVARAVALGLDARAFLANNDSYHFFEPLDGLIRTGPTGTNVMDVRVMLVE
jgi:glycerate 2-kinase